MVIPCQENTGDGASANITGVSKVCIIGAGPSGLAAAKYLLAEKAFSEVKIFEERAQVGGLWNYSAAEDNAHDRHLVPQTDPHGGHDHPIWKDSDGDYSQRRSQNQEPIFISPVYDRLETNIPRGLMGFSDLDWSSDCQLFPRHETVLEYIQCYGQDVMHLIDFETQVLDVRLDEEGKWLVQTQQVSPNSDCAIKGWAFDAVIVASGHFSVPYIPNVPGMQSWDDEYPGSILHSKCYRHPKAFAGKKVVVVGNSASGVDIASQVATACQPPLIQSQKSESFLQPDQSSTKLEKPQIIEFIPEGRKVRFADENVEADVDTVLYCTGYFYSYPFLESLNPPLISTGECVENLFQHIFYRPEPTLSFVALNQKIIPFPVAEAQSAVIARVLSGRLNLPSQSEMERWEQATLQETGGGRRFHVLQFPADADYINMLHDWAMSADQVSNGHHELRKRRLSRSISRDVDDEAVKLMSHGKEPPYWGEKEYWTRERFPTIKKAFQSYGEERRFKKTLEDVGFDFEEWKRERIEEGRTLL